MGRILTVSLHGQTVNAVLQSKFTRLDANGFVYAGGVPQHTLDILKGYKPSSNFKGCLRNLFFDKIQVLVDPTKGNINYRVFGSPENNCQHIRFEALNFHGPGAYLHMNSTGKYLFDIHMRFRTYFANAMLAYKGILNVQYVSLSLVEGKVVIKVQVSPASQVIQFSQGKSLNDGEWHVLSVVVSKTEMKLRVDQLPELKHENPLLKIIERFSENLYIGHYPYSSHSSSFIGCLNDLRVDGKVVKLNKIPNFMFGNLSDRCEISSHCFPNPCLHGGKCNEVRSGSFSCDCRRTFHLGPLCELPIYLRTCLEYRNLGLAEDAYCKVDPDSEGPIGPLKVLCNMTNHNQATTIINHNRIGPQLISSNPRFSNSEVYIHRIKYHDNLERIKALIAQSEQCRQFVSFRCFEAKLMQSPVGPAQVGWLGGGRYELVTDHWPGASAGSGKCACGMNRTCADSKVSCHCDIGDKTWREDKGKAY